MNPKAWGKWATFFTERGYTCHTPAWPYHEGEPADLRQSPDAAWGDLSLEAVYQTMSSFIATLSEKPIVIGHSMGGLVAQRLLNEGKAAAAVPICTVAPNGMITFDWDYATAMAKILNPLAGNSLFEMDVESFQATFCNNMTMEETQAAWQQFVVNESRVVARTSIGSAGKVDLDKPHNPLLFIAGEEDVLMPASLSEKNYNAYTDDGSSRELRTFPNRTHFICGQTGWEEVATFIADWMERQPALVSRCLVFFLFFNCKEPTSFRGNNCRLITFTQNPSNLKGCQGLSFEETAFQLVLRFVFLYR